MKPNDRVMAVHDLYSPTLGKTLVWGHDFGTVIAVRGEWIDVLFDNQMYISVAQSGLMVVHDEPVAN